MAQRIHHDSRQLRLNPKNEYRLLSLLTLYISHTVDACLGKVCMLASGTMCLCLLPVCALTSAHHRSPLLTTAHHRSPPHTTAHHRSPPLTTAHHCSPLLTTARYCSSLLTTGPLPHSGNDACVQCLDAPLTSAAHSNLLFAHSSVGICIRSAVFSPIVALY